MKHYCRLILFLILGFSVNTQGFAQKEIIGLYPNDSIVSSYHNNWTQIHYHQRIEQFKNEPLDFNEIIFIGNSITEKGKDWSEKFGIEHIRNRGISGDVTDGVLKRLNEIVYFKPKAVFILIGINDLFSIHHDDDNRHTLKYDKIVPSTKYVANNILRISKTIHSGSPDTKIFVRTVLPTRRDYLKEDIIAVNKLLKKNAKKGLYTPIDLYAAFVDEDGMMRKEFTDDGVHLSEEGYAWWVKCEKPIISKMVSAEGCIISGIPWYDMNGKVLSAHGAGIIKEGKKYYWFGEYKNNSNNRFEGFSCYSSSDLMKWQFEGIALPPNQRGRLSGAECIGERPKVMKCPSTGEYIMYMHTDSDAYRNPAIEYAVAKNITGPYAYKGRLPFGNSYIKRWDMGAFQDDDGTGYIVMHHGDIYKLADDYKSIVEHTLKHNKTLRTESPVVFKHETTYYWIGSGLTGWERNDNRYFTAKSLAGPWANRGSIAPEGTLTWNSQSTYVLPVNGSKTTTFIYMGDRWSFPKQHSTASYVWQPLVFNDDEISMPEYHESWAVNAETGEWKDVPMKPALEITYTDEAVKFEGNWKNTIADNTNSKRANTSDAKVSIQFNGKQIAIRGVASIDCGYGHIVIINSKGDIVHETWVDMYSNKTVEGLQYMSPVFQYGDYILTFSPTQSHWYWTEKSGKQSGSKDTYISFSKAWVF